MSISSGNPNTRKRMQGLSSRRTALQRLILLGATLTMFHARADLFQNLNFEEARTDRVVVDEFGFFKEQGEGTGPVSDLLPGWQLLRNGESLDTMHYNDPGEDFFSLDRPSLIRPDPDYPIPPRLPTPLEGEYFFRLAVSSSDDYVLRQQADIPVDALSLSYEYRGGPWIVTINDEEVSPHIPPLTYGTPQFDISRFAGQNVELAFRPMPLGRGAYDLDTIRFIVPEPSAVALWVLGVFALVGRWVWSRNRSR